MSEAQDAADHLACTKSQHVGKQGIEELPSYRRERRGILGRCKQGGRKGVTLTVLRPQREEARAKGLPENLELVEDPRLVGDAIVAGGCVPGLRIPTEQQIAKERTQIEADRAVEREFGVYHAAVVLGDHHGAGMQIAVDQCLSAR